MYRLPVKLVLDTFPICPCLGISSVATDELASHNHTVNISWTGLTGDFNGKGFIRDGNCAGTGILSRGEWGSYEVADSIGGYQNNGSVHIDASHSHTASVTNTGADYRHENRPPYIVINRWKRTV